LYFPSLSSTGWEKILAKLNSLNRPKYNANFKPPNQKVGRFLVANSLKLKIIYLLKKSGRALKSMAGGRRIFPEDKHVWAFAQPSKL